jgi:hypothetical protein
MFALIASDNTVKHRPTSTPNKQDIDSDDDDSTLIVAEDDRLKRNINELDKYKDESNIARVLRNNIEKDVGRSRLRIVNALIIVAASLDVHCIQIHVMPVERRRPNVCHLYAVDIHHRYLLVIITHS